MKPTLTCRCKRSRRRAVPVDFSYFQSFQEYSLTPALVWAAWYVLRPLIRFVAAGVRAGAAAVTVGAVSCAITAAISSAFALLRTSRSRERKETYPSQTVCTFSLLGEKGEGLQGGCVLG